MSLKAGTVLNERYRIGAVLGEGGMGTVHRATHLALDQAVAVKVMTDAGSSPNAVHRFMREAKLAAKLRSEHVVHVLDFATTPAGAPYIVLEYLEGSDLADVIDRRGPIDPSTAVDWVLQALVAIAEAHGMGIIHRDLKPGNIFLATLPDGEKIVKVMDFGLSKSLVPDEDASAITHTSALMGTPAYCAPEVLQSARRATALSDLFAMGAVLYQLLTAHRPFDGSTLPDVLAQVRACNPTPPRAIVAEIPSLLEAAVMRCLALDPAARFADVGALALAIAPFGARPGLAKRVVRMLGDDVASERLIATMAAHDKTFEATADMGDFGSSGDSAGSRPVGTVVTSVEPVGLSTQVMEPPARLAVDGAPTRKSGTTARAALAVLLTASVVAGAVLLVNAELVRRRKPDPSLIAIAEAPPPATALPSATSSGPAPPPLAAVTVGPVTTTAPIASIADEPPPATRRPTGATPPTRRPSVGSGPEPPAPSGTTGFGGRH